MRSDLCYFKSWFDSQDGIPPIFKSVERCTTYYVVLRNEIRADVYTSNHFKSKGTLQISQPLYMGRRHAQDPQQIRLCSGMRSGQRLHKDEDASSSKSHHTNQIVCTNQIRSNQKQPCRSVNCCTGASTRSTNSVVFRDEIWAAFAPGRRLFDVILFDWYTRFVL